MNTYYKAIGIKVENHVLQIEQERFITNNKPKLFDYKNIKALIDLIGRYRSLSLKEIDDVWGKFVGKHKGLGQLGLRVANELTGFGTSNSCSVCKSLEGNRCNFCFWTMYDDKYRHGGCQYDNTYYKIACATTPMQLREAFNKRADYIEFEVRKMFTEVTLAVIKNDDLIVKEVFDKLNNNNKGDTGV